MEVSASKIRLGRIPDPPPLHNNDTSPSHLPVLLTLATASNIMEVTAQCGRRMTTWSLAVPTTFVLIPPTTATSFLPDFWLLDSEHDVTMPPDNEA
jgi:hypothetical protein